MSTKVRRYTLKRPEKPQKQYKVRYDEELNSEQLDVVMAGEGPMLVIAGAGSGKTRALTYRVSRLIEDGVDPSEILIVTFTNKSAREMLSRVEQLVTTDTRRIWGGTFHSIGNRLLRRHAEAIGYRPNFTILDSEWSEASGHLTPKMSIKRNVILSDYAGEIDELYSVPVNTSSTSLK